MAFDKVKTSKYLLLGGINSKASTYVDGPMEFRDIVNMNFASPAALSKRPGSTLYLGATLGAPINSGVEFTRLNGASYEVVTSNTNAYTVTSSYNAFKSGLLNNALFSFQTFVDRLFACNGNDYFYFDGSNTFNPLLPNGATNWGVTGIVGGGLSGIFVASFAYLTERNYVGPSSPGITISLNGSTFGSIGYYGLTSPSGFGITSIVLYRTNPGAVDLTGTTYTPANTVTVTDTGFPLTSNLISEAFYFTAIPRYLELYNNQLFQAGFSTMPSTVVWSQIGEPQAINPDFSAEFRTNDGDRITGMKSYNGSLIVSKERSFHRITGDNPNNFNLQEISDQYGCLSHRSMVTYENKLWFLDTKGIVEYTGANVDVVSVKIEPIMQRMNIPAARDNAVGIHYRDANEVWFAIPIDGSTTNNCIIVYDYVTNAWTRYLGINPAAMWPAIGGLTKRTPFIGGYSGTVSAIGMSMMSDSGNGITCSFLTNHNVSAEHTVEMQWRRFYIDVDPVFGFTQPITINFRTNYSTGSSLTRTMFQNPFQSRVDFGLSSRAIQAEVIHASATLGFKVNGYTWESRFQRNV